MNLTCNKQKLLNSINISLKAIPGKSTMKILGFIAIDAEGDKLKLISNNLELGIETSLDADIIEKGKICVDAKIFSEIVRKLPNDEISMKLTNQDNDTDIIGTLQIKSGKAKFDIPVISTDEFPFLPNIVKDKHINLSQLALKEVINQTEFSISDNENNKIMTGELFEINESTLRVVSLDGNRISIRKINLGEVYENKKIIIPGKTLREISKILSDDAEKIVNMYFYENHVLFEFDDTIVLSRLIEGNYYDIDKMLSTDYETKIRVNKQEIFETLDRSLLLLKESDKKPFVLNVNDDKIYFSMKTSIGTLNEDMNVQKEGKDIIIGFNPKFLIDTMKAIGDEEVDMYMINPKAPCFIRNEDESYIYLILPINF